MILSAYAFLKAAVVDYAYSDGDAFFPRAVREGFKESFAIPGATQIWMGAFQGQFRHSGRCNIRIASVGPSQPLHGVQWFTFTYVVGNLVLQLLAPRWEHIQHRGRPLPILSPNPLWEQASSRIWPRTGSAVSWPPPRYFGDETIKPFIERFKNPINIRVTVPNG